MNITSTDYHILDETLDEISQKFDYVEVIWCHITDQNLGDELTKSYDAVCLGLVQEDNLPQAAPSE